MTTELPPVPPTTSSTDTGTAPGENPGPTGSTGPNPGRTAELRRSSTDRMAGGVAGGLADYSGIDPLIWRVGFVALTFAGGCGVLLYLLLWVLMPADDGGPDDAVSPLEQLMRRLHRTLHRNRGTYARR
jgi:phage shock protein C